MVVLIIFVSFLYATIEFILHYAHTNLWRPGKRWLVSIKHNRLRLWENLLFALEILICADIIITVLEPTFDHLLKLWLLIIIRITIAFFLDRELRELKHNDEKQKCE